jgi:hypothetical protein
MAHSQNYRLPISIIFHAVSGGIPAPFQLPARRLDAGEITKAIDERLHVGAADYEVWIVVLIPCPLLADNEIACGVPIGRCSALFAKNDVRVIGPRKLIVRLTFADCWHGKFCFAFRNHSINQFSTGFVASRPVKVFRASNQHGTSLMRRWLGWLLWTFRIVKPNAWAQRWRVGGVELPPACLGAKTLRLAPAMRAGCKWLFALHADWRCFGFDNVRREKLVH